MLGENLSGFRQNRSTADATQLILRVDDATRRVLGYEPKSTRNRPGAVLLDITKAYPRANKPLMWGNTRQTGNTKLDPKTPERLT